jgi:hypothetical protein
MTDIQKEILQIITDVWAHFPLLRFGQLLTGLNIIEFADLEHPEDEDFQLRDIFFDHDKSVLERIKMSPAYLKYEEEKGNKKEV